MFNRKTMALAVLGSAAALCKSASVAQNAQRTPEKSEHFKIAYEDPITSKDISREQELAILTSIEEVRTWFKSMGYPETRLPAFVSPPPQITITDKWGCTEPKNRQKGVANALACATYDPRSGRPKELRVPTTALTLKPDILQETLAHEFAHTHVIGNSETSKLTWMNEAVAEAVGWEWLSKRDGRAFPKVHPTHEMDLDYPFYEGSQKGYEKAPYIGFLLTQIGAPLPDRLGHLSALFEKWPAEGPSQTMHPMQLLYGDYTNDLGEVVRVLDSSVSFPKIFPKFIAQYNNIFEKLSGVDEKGNPEIVGRYYNAIKAIPSQTITVGSELFAPFKLTVHPFAAEGAMLSPKTIKASPSTKDTDRLAIVTIKVEGADVNVGDISLVHEHVVADNRERSYLTYLDSGYLQDFGFVRVTNAGASPAATQEQVVDLSLRVSPVAFALPSCITTKGTTSFPSLGPVSNYRYQASAGRFDGATYQPPSSPQTVKFSLVLESPITRATSGIAPVKRADKIIDLGDAQISNSACSVRMYIQERKENTTTVATQDTERGFTEYRSPDGQYLYARRDQIIAKTRRGWSDPIPASMFAGMWRNLPMRGLEWLEPVFKSAPGGSILAHFSSTPTWALERFDRAEVSKLVDGSQFRKSAVPCPEGTGQCEQLSGVTQGRNMKAIYNLGGQLVWLEFDEVKLTFEYGVSTDDIPPGWGPRPSRPQRPAKSRPNS